MKYLFLVSASLLASVPAFAQDMAEAVPADDGSITVLATGFAFDPDNSGQAISAISRERLDQLQSVTVADALRTLPGVTVTQRGPVGSQTSVFLRGANSAQTLVLIDGVRINDPSSPNAAFDFGGLITGNVEQVEVLRGASSVVWGSQAIGGVVNVESASPSGPLSLSGAFEYGSADTVTARGNVAGSFGAIEASFGGAWYRSDGISALTSGTEADGSDIHALNGRIKAHLADNISLDLRGYYAKARIDYDSPFSGGGNALPVTNNRQWVAYAGLNFDLAEGRWQNRVAYTRTDIHRIGTDPVVFSFNNYDVSGTIDRIEWRSSYELSELALVAAGVEYEKVHASTSFEGFAPDIADNDVTGGYVQLTLRPLAGLSLTGGVRHDDYSDYGGQTTLGGNLSYTPNDGATLLRASVGEGFRAPTLTEGQPPYGNTALRPETARNIDVGIEQALIGGKVRAFAIWFDRRSTDLIVYSFTTFQSENIGKANANGVELGFTADPVPQLHLAASYTLTNTRNEETGKRLQLRPQHSGSVTIDWTSPIGLKLGASALLVGDSFDDAANAVRLDGHALFGLRAALPLSAGVELYGRVDNLFDTGYTVVRGYGTMGRAGTVGVRARF